MENTKINIQNKNLILNNIILVNIIDTIKIKYGIHNVDSITDVNSNYFTLYNINIYKNNKKLIPLKKKIKYNIKYTFNNLYFVLINTDNKYTYIIIIFSSDILTPDQLNNTIKYIVDLNDYNTIRDVISFINNFINYVNTYHYGNLSKIERIHILVHENTRDIIDRIYTEVNVRNKSKDVLDVSVVNYSLFSNFYNVTHTILKDIYINVVDNVPYLKLYIIELKNNKFIIFNTLKMHTIDVIKNDLGNVYTQYFLILIYFNILKHFFLYNKYNKLECIVYPLDNLDNHVKDILHKISNKYKVKLTIKLNNFNFILN